MARLLNRIRTRSASGGGPEGGMALVLSMSVALVVFALGAVWLGLGTHQVTITGRDKLRDQARNVAEAGLNAAMSGLSADASFTGIGLTAVNGGEFEVSVLPVSVDPSDPRRYLVAKGYAPTKASPKRVARRLEQQIELLPTDGFRYALFSAPGGIAGANKMTVNGDVYAGGNVTMTGHVKGSVQAGGTISGGTVDGGRAQHSPPAPPAPQTLPTFTWDPANYTTVSNWASPAAFNTYWSSHTAAFSGAHRISCPAPCTTAVNLGSKWTVTDDTTIVADGPISVSRDIANGAGHPVTLTIVSFASDTASTPAITMSNNVTLPDDMEVVYYANHGSVKFSNLKHFTGTVYASSIQLDQQFTLTFKPVVLAGFDFGLTSSSHFQIQAGAFKEVPYS